MKERLIGKVGNWVEGDCFFDREDELAQLLGMLRRGEHVSLIAQRRMGKTSLLREAARLLKGDMDVIYLDLQDVTDAPGAVASLGAAAAGQSSTWERARKWIESKIDRVEELGADKITLKLRAAIAGDWREAGDRIVTDLATGPRPLVWMIDELPIMLSHLLRDEQRRPRPEGLALAEQFMGWLRRVALQHANLRVVVTGSIGLEPLARQAGLSATLNHYAPMQLGAWEPDIARQAVHALAAYDHLRVSDDGVELLLDRLGSNIPYHVQLVYRNLADDANKRKSADIRAVDVERVYEQRILGAQGHAELAHMEERLRRVLPTEQVPLALDLLTETAVLGRLSAEAAQTLAVDLMPGDQQGRDVLRSVLDLLEHDGYLSREGSGWRFVSRLLQDWWKRRFELFYRPATSRRL